jgi:hypothetical protein
VGEPLLQPGIVGLAVGQAQPPAVVVDHDRDVVAVVEGGRAVIEGDVGVANVQQASVDLPQQANGGVLVRGFDHLALRET